MDTKSYKVYFARTSVGKSGETLAKSLTDTHKEWGRNLPIIGTNSEGHQIRDLEKIEIGRAHV
jgi:hypothetical protein